MKLIVSLLLLLLLPQVFSGDPKKQGRQGNALYKQDQYQEAADAYSAGLATYQNGNETDATFYGLQNNLGATLYRKQDFAQAQAAFGSAMEAASNEADYARAAYNAGNNAFNNEQAEAALDHYRNALLADPANADAKFNYEFVKRQLEQQQNQQQQNDQDQNQEQNEEEQQQDQQNQDQQQDQQNQDQQQQQEQQNQDQQQQEQQQEQQQQEQQQDQQLSRQQAERILQALENEEEELLREVQKVKGRPRRVEKDW